MCLMVSGEFTHSPLAEVSPSHSSTSSAHIHLLPTLSSVTTGDDYSDSSLAAVEQSQQADAGPRTKRCSGCKVVKSVSHFFKDNKSADGLNSRCKSCKNTNNTKASRQATQAARQQARRDAETQGWQVHLRKGGLEHTFFRQHPTKPDVVQVQITPTLICLLDTDDWMRVQDYGLLMKNRVCLKVNARSTGLARFVLRCDATDGMVNHVDGDILNNTKQNLWLGMPLTGQAGVYHRADLNQWQCRIWLDNEWQTRVFAYQSKEHPSYEQARQRAIVCRQENNALPGTGS